MTKLTRPKKIKVETYICPNCGQKMYVPRIRSRERGHIKDMWCARCKGITKFVKEEKFNVYGRDPDPGKKLTLEEILGGTP